MPIRRLLIIGCFAFIAAACAPQSASPWRVLFGGTSLKDWKGYKTDTVPSGWKIENGTLTKDGHVGDLISRDDFGDFELELDWKIGHAGNSGIFYRGTEDADYHGPADGDRIYTTGPEYQLLDDIDADDNKTRLTCAAAAYGLYPSEAGHLKPVGDWNQARIVARGAHVEHWLNGVKLVEYELWSSDWEAKVQATKFRAWPKFGRARSGRIGLQGDHAGILAFRNIRIRDLR
jgi:3-keto-disaccharide hydrolase